MLVTTEARDLIAEIKVILDELNLFTSDAEKLAHKAQNHLFGNDGAYNLLARWAEREDGDGRKDPTEVVMAELRHLSDPVSDAAEDFERRAGAIWDRLTRMVDLLELEA